MLVCLRKEIQRDWGTVDNLSEVIYFNPSVPVLPKW